VQTVKGELMEELVFEKPSLKRKKDAIEFIKEFLDYKSNINGSGGLDKGYLNYKYWLNRVIKNSKEETVEKGKVPASTYFVVRNSDNKIVGMVNIRHRLNDYLLQYSGHIGDCVRPTERRKGFATQMLYMSLVECKDLGIEKVLLICDKTNMGSSKQIINNLGQLENEVKDEKGRTIQRYWIDVENTIRKGTVHQQNKKVDVNKYI